MKPQELKDHIKELYPQAVFREGTRHTQASLNDGKSWTPLGPRHAKDIKKPTYKEIMKQLALQLEIDRDEGKAQSPEEWAQEVRSLDLMKGKEPKITLASPLGGRYNGLVMHVDHERYCVQKTAPDALVIHETRNLQRIPAIGEVARINYTEGRGEVIELNPLNPRTYAEKTALAQSGIDKTKEAVINESYLGPVVAETKQYMIQRVGRVGILHLKETLPNGGRTIEVGGKDDILLDRGQYGHREIFSGKELEAEKNKTRSRGQERGR